MDIRNMDERELRLYKNKLRRKKIVRRRMIVFALAVSMILVTLISAFSFKSSAESSIDHEYKYYTSVTVKYGDTLYDISDRYIDYDHYASKAEYIREVASINGLNSKCDIISGQMIIVPYYSAEYK
ncbi:MAG: LysM peptidoglycan-binding domain-containing protein [Acetatifactor sp.]|nr:LysM peptidoglycan-binding domain-containing protein [Acetatifactor sp.]